MYVHVFRESCSRVLCFISVCLVAVFCIDQSLQISIPAPLNITMVVNWTERTAGGREYGNHQCLYNGNRLRQEHRVRRVFQVISLPKFVLYVDFLMNVNKVMVIVDFCSIPIGRRDIHM